MKGKRETDLAAGFAPSVPADHGLALAGVPCARHLPQQTRRCWVGAVAAPLAIDAPVGLLFRVGRLGPRIVGDGRFGSGWGHLKGGRINPRVGRDRKGADTAKNWGEEEWLCLSA